MKTSAYSFLILLTLLVCVDPTSLGKHKPTQAKTKSSKKNTDQPYVLMNGNNVTSWVRSDGFFPALVQQSWNGEYPKGSGIGTIYQEGIVFGGLVNDGLYSNSLRVTGDTYFIGMQPGAMNTDGTVNPSDDSLLSARAFGVRSDMPPFIASSPSIWPDLTGDVASFFTEPLANVTEAQRTQVASQYFADWSGWPSVKGAPWFVDSIKQVRHDAGYDPTNPHHIPGIPGASKTIWFVCNDANPAVTAQFAGSPPIGMEEQVTLWCYASSSPLNNIIFKQVRLIYKGNPGAANNSRIDSLYIAQWADPDVGNTADDFAGSDSVLNLGYAYNATNVDAKYLTVGLPPPAVGFAFLQGASHYTGNTSDSAIVDFQWRAGYSYWYQRPLTASVSMGPSSAITDPEDIEYDGTLQWFNLMRCCLPRPEYPAGIPFCSSSPYATTHHIVTNYILPGDPITGQGWIDGYDTGPDDKRIIAIHGPISLNLRDTAEVVIALIDGMGADYLSSVRDLKSSAAYARTFFDELPNKALPPIVTCSVKYSSLCTVSFQADARAINASGIVACLKTYDNVVIATDTLTALDNFAGPNETLFAGSIQVPQQQSGLYADAIVTYADGTIARWPHVADNITTAGPLGFVSPIIVSDNLNSDGIANPGENVRFTFTLMNNSAVNLHHLSLTTPPLGKTIFFETLSSNVGVALHYDPNDILTYFYFDIPTTYTDSIFSIPILITDSLNDIWSDTVRFRVVPFAIQPYGSELVHTNGRATGNFSIIVVDSTAIKNHTYEIQGVDSIDAAGDPGVTLIDQTSNTTVFANHTLPDSLGHTMPVTDGFKILRGTTRALTAGQGMGAYSVPSGVRHFSPIGGFAGLGLEGFGSATDTTLYDRSLGTIGWANHFVYGGIGTTLNLSSQAHTVLLKLAAVNFDSLWNPLATPSDSNFSKGYRFLRDTGNNGAAQPSFVPWILNAAAGFPYQDYNYGVPFSAWDIDVNPPVRLAVGFMENNVFGATVDGRYWPPQISGGDNTVNREFCFIFGVPYTTTPNPAFQTNILNNSSLPIMWVMTCNIRNTSNWQTNDEFLIIAARFPTNGDIWTFNPTIETGVNQPPALPISYSLSQNYPNPFNPSTTIRYQLPGSSKVVIKIYNLLGQEVRTLVNNIEIAGDQSATWDSKNDNGQTVSSGVYFYRMQATPLSRGEKSYVEAKKMLLIK